MLQARVARGSWPVARVVPTAAERTAARGSRRVREKERRQDWRGDSFEESKRECVYVYMYLGVGGQNARVLPRITRRYLTSSTGFLRRVLTPPSRATTFSLFFLSLSLSFLYTECPRIRLDEQGTRIIIISILTRAPSVARANKTALLTRRNPLRSLRWRRQ